MTSSATELDIAHKFSVFARIVHPDKYSGEYADLVESGTEAFKKLNNAQTGRAYAAFSASEKNAEASLKKAQDDLKKARERADKAQNKRAQKAQGEQYKKIKKEMEDDINRRRKEREEREKRWESERAKAKA